MSSRQWEDQRWLALLLRLLLLRCRAIQIYETVLCRALKINQLETSYRICVASHLTVFDMLEASVEWLVELVSGGVKPLEVGF